MSAQRTTDAAGTAAAGSGADGRQLHWPGDPESVAGADIDFEALAHVLANTCCWSGRTRHYHSLAGHALIASEEIEALDGLGTEDRRVLALHALLNPAPAAWLGGEAVGSRRAAEPGSRLEGRDRSRTGPGRTARLSAGIERAVREAAGLDPVLGDEHAELLRFISRMTFAAERRDLFGADAPPDPGAAFPPLKRRIRPVGPGRAAQLWLARLRALIRPPGADGAGSNTGGSGEQTETGNGEDGDVAHIPATERVEPQAPRGGRDARKAA